MATRAIDCWVNVNMGEQAKPEWLLRVKEDYFRAGDEFFKSLTIDETLEMMNRVGCEKAVVTVDAERPSERVLEFPRRQPARFALAAAVSPNALSKGCWALEDLTRSERVVMARVVPFQVDLPPHHRNYYPLYAKCVELDLPISINTGIPGPPMPGECQNPMHLDRVCLDFPQLKICMAHGADPWWSVAIRLMIKYRNLHLMTSAYSPRYFPPELVHFMNTRGQEKILFASDHPVLSTERCIKEASELDLRPGVLDKFLYTNAERLFFSPRKPRH
jgi:predicted TIM-barrel fold metal-dependent hydrolase